MSLIFLGHSSKDTFSAIALRDWLASEGWKEVFLDLDPESEIGSGERWEHALKAAASQCEAVIFLVSANWLASTWSQKEYRLAYLLGKRLFIALIDPTVTPDALPTDLIEASQIVNLTAGTDPQVFSIRAPGFYEERRIEFSKAALLRLKRGLESAGLDPRFFHWPPEGQPDRIPYRGLSALDAVDAGVFFGRDATIVEAVERLRVLRLGAPPKLLAILGASGAGKSSFLRAGLLPRLARHETHFIPLPVVRPERAAITGPSGFIAALATVLPSQRRSDLRTMMQLDARALQPLLVEFVKHVAAQRMIDGDTTDRPAVVIAIDQAEELFRPECQAESEPLLHLLADLSKLNDPAVVILFCVRSDSYEALQRSKALAGLQHHALALGPMLPGAYQEVIEGPARRLEAAGRKLKIEPALTERLLVDIAAGAGDALPLLAFTLERLYLNYGNSGVLRLADYEKSNGLQGAIDVAVERAFRRADSDPRLPKDRRDRLALLRRGLIPWLASVDPESRAPRRNIARRADIPTEARPLIELLIEERLLSADARLLHDPITGASALEAIIEPAHEALLRQWSQLSRWLNDDFGQLTILEAIKRAARDWDVNARNNAWLLHHGRRLLDAEHLDARPDLVARLDASDRAYLTACRSRENTLLHEVDGGLHEHEIHLGNIPQQVLLDVDNRRYYVSYAWSDATAPTREQHVDRLCEEARKRGYQILRDKKMLHYGELISEFMQRLSEGDRVFIFISDKYLKSQYCMYELFQMWRNRRQDKAEFLRHVRVFTIDGSNISSPSDWLAYTKYWKMEREKLRQAINDVGWEEAGEEVMKRFIQINTFTRQISDILALFADTVQPRTFDDFLQYGFDDPPSDESTVLPTAH